MRVIVGLGNPGLTYRSTKHNIGFAVVEALAKKHGIRLGKALHFSRVGRGVIAGEEVLLALPQTFMNLSGKAVGELYRAEAQDAARLLVVCDDIHLELGKLRLRPGGSAGGHKGLASIIQTLGRDDFPRLRVGIATGLHRGDLSRYVLSPFKRKDAKHVKHIVALAAETVTAACANGIDAAMATYNKCHLGTS